MRKHLLFALATVSILGGGITASDAIQILVGQCVQGADCYNAPLGVPTSWSDSLTSADLIALGLGSDVPLVATQTSVYVVDLGPTTIDFVTSGAGDVKEMLPQFDGGAIAILPPYQPMILGDFAIPSDAVSADISGTFGISTSPSSAGVNVCLGNGNGACGIAATPLPSTWTMLIEVLSVSASSLIVGLIEAPPRSQPPDQNTASSFGETAARGGFLFGPRSMILQYVRLLLALSGRRRLVDISDWVHSGRSPAANDAMAAIHNRMRVILAPRDWSAWLGETAASDNKDLLDLLGPCLHDLLKIWPVDKAGRQPPR